MSTCNSDRPPQGIYRLIKVSCVFCPIQAGTGLHLLRQDLGGTLAVASAIPAVRPSGPQTIHSPWGVPDYWTPSHTSQFFIFVHVVLHEFVFGASPSCQFLPLPISLNHLASQSNGHPVW